MRQHGHDSPPTQRQKIGGGIEEEGEWYAKASLGRSCNAVAEEGEHDDGNRRDGQEDGQSLGA